MLKGKDIPHSLTTLINYSLEENIEIIYIVSYGEEDKITIAIADFSQAVHDVNYLVERLKKDKRIEGIRVIPPRTGGLLILEGVKPVSYCGRKTIIQSSQHFYSIIEGLGEASSGAILWHLWYKGGKYTYEAHRRIRGEGNSIDTLVDALLSTQALGWWEDSKIIAYNSIKKMAKVRLWNSWECYEIKKSMGIMSKPQSQLVRGFLSGLFSEHFGVEVVAEEVKCMAMGDPYCEFDIKPLT